MRQTFMYLGVLLFYYTVGAAEPTKPKVIIHVPKKIHYVHLIEPYENMGGREQETAASSYRKLHESNIRPYERHREVHEPHGKVYTHHGRGYESHTDAYESRGKGREPYGNRQRFKTYTAAAAKDPSPVQSYTRGNKSSYRDYPQRSPTHGVRHTTSGYDDYDYEEKDPRGRNVFLVAQKDKGSPPEDKFRSTSRYAPDADTDYDDYGYRTRTGYRSYGRGGFGSATDVTLVSSNQGRGQDVTLPSDDHAPTRPRGALKHPSDYMGYNGHGYNGFAHYDDLSYHHELDHYKYGRNYARMFQYGYY